jgi:putative zinc finger/helix-turn-helix YgiT family protein
MKKCGMCQSDTVKSVNLRRPYDLKGETFDLIAQFSKCQKCGFEFATDDQLFELRVRTADAYRKKHGLLTSNEIKSFRDSLGMNQVDFAKFLEVGEASIARWETCYVQEQSMNKLILFAMDSNAAKLHSRAGNANMSWERLVELALLALEKVDSPLFAWKVLFYFDFNAYKSIGRSLTGSAYVAGDYGPIPETFPQLGKYLTANNLAEMASKAMWKVKRKPDLSIFDEQEIEVINSVLNFVKDKGKQKVFDLSHSEDAYNQTILWETIDYKHAKSLRHPVSAKR